MLRAVAVALALLLGSAGAAAGEVDAADHDAFWLWSGVAAQPVLAQARTLYVLQGQVSAPRYKDGNARLIAQGIAIPRLSKGEVWVVYRAHTLRWHEDIYRILLAQLRRWRAAGNPVVGVQIDFDARTRYLGEYVEFLEGLRKRLPADCRLSITGLMDWGSNAAPETINRLAGVVDEVVVQTYQGRHTIPNYQAYLPRVARLQLPFRIGLAQYGEWQAPDYLARSPWFRGYVVFLQNP
ncbi:DUF3142 domain-containing protein [Pseudomonas sp. LA21]|uniref:DUF3142 domain-containing protein n=1 Tax=unclassified Pseudomonas TaxID=196821 RepID=UPI001FB6CC27|nr:DUF3142 domain-containing protein [Pseudomonas sp. LA21]MCJ1886351.1 DUF3142 domain-containing protein [Pseudomonas sp. LA21]